MPLTRPHLQVMIVSSTGVRGLRPRAQTAWKGKVEGFMDVNRMRGHQQWLREELDRCVAFWLNNGMDREHGGV